MLLKLSSGERDSSDVLALDDMADGGQRTGLLIAALLVIGSVTTVSGVYIYREHTAVSCRYWKVHKCQCVGTHTGCMLQVTCGARVLGT